MSQTTERTLIGVAQNDGEVVQGIINVSPVFRYHASADRRLDNHIETMIASPTGTRVYTFKTMYKPLIGQHKEIPPDSPVGSLVQTLVESQSAIETSIGTIAQIETLSQSFAGILLAILTTKLTGSRSTLSPLTPSPAFETKSLRAPIDSRTVTIILSRARENTAIVMSMVLRLTAFPTSNQEPTRRQALETSIRLTTREITSPLLAP